MYIQISKHMYVSTKNGLSTTYKAVRPLTMTTCRGAMEENIAQFVSDTVTELFDMLGKGEVGFKQF